VNEIRCRVSPQWTLTQGFKQELQKELWALAASSSRRNSGRLPGGSFLWIKTGSGTRGLPNRGA
jgi:hypothetical protein